MLADMLAFILQGNLRIPPNCPILERRSLPVRANIAESSGSTVLHAYWNRTTDTRASQHWPLFVPKDPRSVSTRHLYTHRLFLGSAAPTRLKPPAEIRQYYASHLRPAPLGVT